MAARSLSIDSKDLELLSRFLDSHASRASVKDQKALYRLAKSFASKAKTPTVRSAKAKGMGLQWDMAEWVCKRLGMPFDNSDDTCEVHSRPSGQNGADLVLTGSARELFPFSVECKATRVFSFKEATKQAAVNAKDDQIPLVFHRPLGDGVYAIFDLESFSRLVDEYVLS